MTYEKSLVYLSELCKFGINLGLARIEKLLELLENPQRRFKSIHITGTNGKGSTSAMLAAMLQAAGCKTGMYTSPHLEEYTERITVDGREISRADFATAIEHTGRLAATVAEGELGQPTEFEVLTAAAFYHFARCKVEYAVIEVGLGGLLDSTNVIMPQVAVITNVTMDHLDKCGSTLLDIAAHKAGIIKAGRPVVTAAQEPGLSIIRQAAKEQRAKLYVCDEEFTAQWVGKSGQRQKVRVASTELELAETFEIGLLGHHQAKNCAAAVMAARLLALTEPRLTMEAMHNGLAAAVWPGRFEVVPGNPLTVIDGAHNLAGALALRQNLDEFFSGQSIVYLLGILRDKDISGITGTLIRPSDKVVVVAPDSERAGDPAVIAQEIQAELVETALSIEAGLARAREIAGPAGIVCVAGSLYLVGTARRLIWNK